MRHLFGVRELLVAAILTSVPAFGQTAAEQQEYRAAVAKPRGPEQTSALERFAAAHPQSRLKIDALELLVWNSRGSARVADLEYWTGQLLSVAPENPLASAVILGEGLNISSENRESYAKRTLPRIESLDRPEGMSHEDFSALKNFVTATLNGIVGYSYFEQNDFASARPYLRKALEINPRNAQYTYTLALCDLDGPNQDQAEGYLMLARAVNLTKGTPAGDRLAAFARQNFQQAGGDSAGWDKYLAAAVPPLPQPMEAPTPVESAVATTTVPAAPTTAAATKAPAVSSRVATPAASGSTATAASTSTTSSTPTVGTSPTGTAPANTAPAATASAVSARTPSPTTTGGGGIGTPSAMRTSAAASTKPVAPADRVAILVASSGPSPNLPNGSPASPPASAPAAVRPPSPDSTRPLRVFPPRPVKHIAPGSPVSVGVLIQASLTNPADRKPVVFSLSDLVRHLRDKDEAFIMSFSRGVVFQEDLTSNSKSLETAMDSIAPTPGAAIYDAVTFAAGHLDRVAKNPNRILLVIAAEGDRDSTVSPLELSSEINLSGVTIYCIGVGVVTPTDQDRLQQLADSTGGRAIFISDLSRFRDATKTIAQGLGIAF